MPAMDPNAQATLRTIADRTGTSVSTVSRVLNGCARQYRISDKTAQRVLKVAADLDFTPNLLAKGLRLRRTHTIGLVIPDIANPFFAAIASAVASEVRSREHSILLCDTQEDTGREIEALALLASRQIDGLVLVPVGQVCDHLHPYVGGATPAVIVDRWFPGLGLSYVASDNRRGALEATRHLTARGHRRIACIRGLAGTTPNEERVHGYRDALAEARIAVDERLIVGESFGNLTGYQETKLLLARIPDLTAILALSNLISLGVLQALAEEGRAIPGDISVVGFDDQPYSSLLATPMTMVRQRSAELGQLAVKLLFERMAGTRGDPPTSITLPTELVMRRSVGDIGKR